MMPGSFQGTRAISVAGRDGEPSIGRVLPGRPALLECMARNSVISAKPSVHGGEKVGHGSGGMMLLRAE
jgi:hypothetical protein